MEGESPSWMEMDGSEDDEVTKCSALWSQRIEQNEAALLPPTLWDSRSFRDRDFIGNDCFPVGARVYVLVSQ